MCLLPSPPTRKSGGIVVKWGEVILMAEPSKRRTADERGKGIKRRLRTVLARTPDYCGCSHLRHSKTKIQHTDLVCCIFGWGEVIRTPE